MLFIFDVGGVVTNSAAIYPLVAHKLNITTEQFLQFCGKPIHLAQQDNSLLGPHAPVSETGSDQEVQQFSPDIALALTKGTIDVATFWSIFTERSHLTPKENYWYTMFTPVPNKAVYSIISRLKRNYRVVNGTNTIQDHYDIHMAHHDYDIFDKIYASQLMHEAKPEPSFWKYILNEEHVEPEDTFFIDDSPVNVLTAASLGINTHHFTDAAHLEQALTKWL